MSGLLDKRLVLIIGKGGVGRTTVAAALGIVAARSGRRTMVCEVAGQERITTVFGQPPAGFKEREVEPGLFALSVSPERAQEEWLSYQLPSDRLAGLLGGSSLFQHLTAAAPGLRELVTIGKVWELSQLERKTEDATPYDTVIVDAPATGHGLAMLSAPRTFREIVRAGPIARHAELIDALVTDPEQTGVVAVARAEEMPVNETLDLERRLTEEIGLRLDGVIVNALHPQRLTKADAEALAAIDHGTMSEAATAALEAAASARSRARGQRNQLRRLRRHVRAPVHTLPFLFESALGLGAIERLAGRLERHA